MRAALLSFAASWVMRPPVQRWLESVTGAVFIGFGVRLALARD